MGVGNNDQFEIVVGNAGEREIDLHAGFGISGRGNRFIEGREASFLLHRHIIRRQRYEQVRVLPLRGEPVVPILVRKGDLDAVGQNHARDRSPVRVTHRTFDVHPLAVGNHFAAEPRFSISEDHAVTQDEDHIVACHEVARQDEMQSRVGGNRFDQVGVLRKPRVGEADNVAGQESRSREPYRTLVGDQVFGFAGNAVNRESGGRRRSVVGAGSDSGGKQQQDGPQDEQAVRCD